MPSTNVFPLCYYVFGRRAPLFRARLLHSDKATVRSAHNRLYTATSRSAWYPHLTQIKRLPAWTKKLYVFLAGVSLSGILVSSNLDQDKDNLSGAQCQSTACPKAVTQERSTPDPLLQLDEEGLRRTALEYLSKVVAERNWECTEPHAERDEAGYAFLISLHDDIGHEGLPEHLYDMDKIISKSPLVRKNNAFHETLNGDDTIRCPYVLNRPGKQGAGIDAVVHFGKAIAGHPKIVHGGIMALTFDNLCGWALFLQGAGAVVTAYLKVDYKAPLPCLTTATVDVTIDRIEGRKLFVSARLRSMDERVLYASAEALFIKPKSQEKTVG